MKSRDFLGQFQREWTYHDPISDKQLEAAGIINTVKGVAFYYGGDALYTLSNTMGTWHEECLEQVTEC